MFYYSNKFRAYKLRLISRQREFSSWSIEISSSFKGLQLRLRDFIGSHDTEMKVWNWKIGTRITVDYCKIQLKATFSSRWMQYYLVVYLRSVHTIEFHFLVSFREFCWQNIRGLCLFIRRAKWRANAVCIVLSSFWLS